MKKRTTVGISLLIILFLLPAWTRAEREKGDSIRWLILDLPPFFVTKGPGDFAILVEKTGFEKKKLHNILYRLRSQGKVKSVGKGVYSKVSS
ncbi:MAG: hypothetical protein ISS63_08415 [Desulfobacteraceae bacterium]|nr:hypothetical protein [Desulfobacteraceae bacterium]